MTKKGKNKPGKKEEAGALLRDPPPSLLQDPPPPADPNPALRNLPTIGEDTTCNLGGDESGGGSGLSTDTHTTGSGLSTGTHASDSTFVPSHESISKSKSPEHEDLMNTGGNQSKTDKRDSSQSPEKLTPPPEEPKTPMHNEELSLIHI